MGAHLILLFALLSFIFIVVIGIFEYASDYEFFEDIVVIIIGLWVAFAVYWLIKLS